MAGPILAKAARKAGRKLYRDARGRFISKAKAELEERRLLSSSRFGTAAQASSERAAEVGYRALWGAPQSGWTWVRLTTKYPERFIDYIPDDLR